MSAASPGAPPQQRPSRPPRSVFAISMAVLAVVMTVVTVLATEFSLANVLEDLTRPNSSFRGLVNLDWSQVTNPRTLGYFVETLQLAIVGTVVGGFLALPLALFNSEVGAPNRVVRWVAKVFADVIRSIPDLLWALLFVAILSIGNLPGALALTFFAMAVITKLTSDIMDGIDQGPIEAADACGARHAQMLRTAIVPQILPSYVSFLLYGFELNLRASAVIGFVGAGGIGARIDFYRNQGDWAQVWGIIVLFFIVTFLVERLSVTLRRRLV